MPVWVGPVLALTLAVFNASLPATAHHWPGWLGGALSILTALLGFLAWRKAVNPLVGPSPFLSFGYGGWLLVSFIVFTQAYDLETRLNVGPLRAGDLIFLFSGSFWAVHPCGKQSGAIGSIQPPDHSYFLSP